MNCKQCESENGAAEATEEYDYGMQVAHVYILTEEQRKWFKRELRLFFEGREHEMSDRDEFAKIFFG